MMAAAKSRNKIQNSESVFRSTKSNGQSRMLKSSHVDYVGVKHVAAGAPH